jgi:hypothetical protein
MSINQIGNLLNFVAGFLLAPDIFGEEKLIKWQQALQKVLPNLQADSLCIAQLGLLSLRQQSCRSFPLLLFQFQEYRL